MTDKEWIEPTEKEKDSVRKMIMEAIYPIIKPMEADEDYPDSARRILSAVEIAKKLEKEADNDFEAKHPDNNAHGHYCSVMDIVATCIAAIVTESPISMYPPHSLAGQHIVAFANASRIISAAWRLECEMDCDTDEYGYDIAKKLMREKSLEK